MLRFNSAFSHHAAAPYCAAAARRNVSFLCRKATANVSAGARRNRPALQDGKLGCWFWVGALPHPSKMGSFYAGSGSRASRLPLHRDCSGSRERPEVHGMVLYLFHPMRALCGIGAAEARQTSNLKTRVQLPYAAPYSLKRHPCKRRRSPEHFRDSGAPSWEAWLWVFGKNAPAPE